MGYVAELYLLHSLSYSLSHNDVMQDEYAKNITMLCKNEERMTCKLRIMGVRVKNKFFTTQT